MRSDESLRRLVGDVPRFLAEHFGKTPLLRRGAGGGPDPVDGWRDLLTLEDVDRLVQTTRAPGFRLVQDGEVLARSRSTRRGTVGGVRVTDLPDVGAILDLFDDGATLVLQGLNRSHPPVAALCRGLERALTHPVQANAYLTPPSAAGLDVHHDTHDVFVLQLHGRKQWTTWPPEVSDPLPGQVWRGDVGDLGEPALDERLDPGDLLYLPRGTLHAARTVERASLHLTIGVRSPTAHDVLDRVLRLARDEPAFRVGLPAGFARDRESFGAWVAGVLEEFATWTSDLDGGEVADGLADDFFASHPPLLDGQLRQLLSLAELDDHSRVTRRVGATADLRPAEDRDDRVALHLGDRTVTLPAFTQPAVERLMGAEDLEVSALADVLGDEHSRCVLVRRLVREGLLVADLDAR